MDNFNDFLNQYKVPIGLSLVGLVLIIGGLFSSGLVQTKSQTQAKNFPSESKINPTQLNQNGSIKVDISGAVKNPSVYDLASNSRVEDAVKIAGGFLSSANKEYISKSINLSAKLSDGSKIYIPFTGELTGGIIAGISSSGTSKISLNSASQQDLEKLPGIGPVSASKIIQNRPYGSIEDLLSKKVVSKTVFAKIKDLVDPN